MISAILHIFYFYVIVQQGIADENLFFTENSWNIYLSLGSYIYF